jgi:hypothetical protein
MTIFNTLSEVEQLRRRLSWAEGELTRIGREAALKAIADREQAAAAEVAEAAATQQVVHAAELEGHRINSWINHRVDSALASANPDDAMAALLSRTPGSDIPPGAWPPGVSAADFDSVVALAAMPAVDETVRDTALGQALAHAGVKVV